MMVTSYLPSPVIPRTPTLQLAHVVPRCSYFVIGVLTIIQTSTFLRFGYACSAFLHYDCAGILVILLSDLGHSTSVSFK